MLTQKPTIEGSTLEPDSQQAAIVLTKEKSKKTNEKSKTQKKTNKKSTQMPTNSPTNTKMMTVCHIPKRDPSACYDKSIRTSALKAHLDHGDLEGKCDSSCISFCASVGTCSEGNNLSRCICCDCKQECFTGTRVECEVGSINICRFNAELNTSETVCMAEASVSSHLRKHSSDYYGKCEEEIFVQNSVLLNVPPAQGTEEVDQYTLEYDVSFNEDGIVVLGKSFEIIDEVLCSSHQVDIFFPKPLAPGRLSSMFPTSAILVVNGDLFGTECSFVPPYEGSQRPTFNIGFLIIETSHVDGSIVTITGTPTIFDAIFEEQSMVYRASSSGKGIQRRSLFEFNLPEEEFEAKFPPEGPVQIVSKVTRSASISIGDSVFTSKWTRVGFLPKLLEATMYREIGYKMKVKNENSLEITGSAFEFKCPDEDNKFCPETEFSKVFPDFPIPGFGVSTPKFITKLLGINFSRLGLVFSIPVTLDFKIEAPISMKINVSFRRFCVVHVLIK